MPVFHSDIVKLLDRFDQQRIHRENKVAKCIKQGKPFHRERIPNLDELKTLILLLYLTKIRLKRLLDLRSNDIVCKKNHIIFLVDGKNISVSLSDPFMLIAWEYLKTISVKGFVFNHLRKKKNIHAILEQYFLCFNHRVCLRDFY